MSTEGEIKMKEGRSSGEARRQQAFMRRVKGKTEFLRSAEPTENAGLVFDETSRVRMFYRGIVSARLSSL